MFPSTPDLMLAVVPASSKGFGAWEVVVGSEMPPEPVVAGSPAVPVGLLSA